MTIYIYIGSDVLHYILTGKMRRRSQAPILESCDVPVMRWPRTNLANKMAWKGQRPNEPQTQIGVDQGQLILNFRKF